MALIQSIIAILCFFIKDVQIFFFNRFISYGYGDDDSDQYAQSETRYNQIKNYLGGDSIEHRNQYITMPT